MSGGDGVGCELRGSVGAYWLLDFVLRCGVACILCAVLYFVGE